MADTFKGIITADGKKRQLPYENVLKTPISDETLSIQGGFADAKVVGDKFKAVKVETDSLKEDLEKLDDFISQTELEVINGEYLSFEGVITQNNGFGRTNYIPCDGYSGIKVYTPIETSLCGFFDADKNFIKQFTAKNGTHNVIVPYNACYYMLSNNKENIGLMRVEISEHSKDVSDVDRIKSLLCVKRVTEDVKANSEFKAGFYPIKASAITPSEWYETYLFDVAMGDIISYRGQTKATSVLYDYIRIFDRKENIIDAKPNEIGLKDVSGDIVIRNTNASKVLITMLKGNSTITRTFSNLSTNRGKYKKNSMVRHINTRGKIQRCRYFLSRDYWKKTWYYCI
nr:MAG TPA: hypothetical protein [Caudoviricetes sp.]